MANELGSNDQWDRVASELRAYRQAQQQAWGEIDNTTLGRFIADDLSGEERHQIEHALKERPELRKLTDLVRDVLADFEPATDRVAAPHVPPPRILPFPKKQTSRPSVIGWVKKRSGILAAACLLLALSGALLDARGGTAFVSSAPERTLTDSSTVAMVRSGQQPVFVSFKKPVETTNLQEKAGLDRLEILNQKIDGLEQQGKYEQALRLDERASTVARRSNLEGHLAFAENREKVAGLSQKQGDLDRACNNLCQAYEIRKKEQGLESKETAKTVRSLANVYAVAINSSDSPRGAVAPSMVLPAAKDRHSIGDIWQLESAKGPTPPPAPPDRHFTASAGLRPDPERKNVKELHDRLVVHQDVLFLRQQVVPVMVQGLENAATEKERVQFVRALGRIGPAADDALPSIVEFLHSDSAEIRRTAANTLVLMGPAAEEYLSLYLKVEVKDAVPDAGAKGLVQEVLKRLDAGKERRVRLGLAVGPGGAAAIVIGHFGD